MSNLHDARGKGVVYLIRAAERPGIAFSISAVFSHRGLSIEALVADTKGAQARILVVFRGTPRQIRMVGCVLERLHHVSAVEILDLDSPLLQAVALVRPAGSAPWSLPTDISEQAIGDLRLLTGRYDAIDRCVAALNEHQQIESLSRTLVAVEPPSAEH